MPKISIVVPVYKVEDYIERCVSSLRKQTILDIEIILVDDGSPDESGEMCDKFASQDNRIKVVHKKNGGLSSARNAGMKVAIGKYIGFVDSDDDIELDMYEKMVLRAEQQDVDCVMADYTRIFSDGKKEPFTTVLDGGMYDKQAIINHIFPKLIMDESIDYGPLLSVWHCIYRTDFLRENDIWFEPEIKWSEDNLFSAIVGYNANGLYYMKGEQLYHYYQNPGTITTSYRSGAWWVYRKMNEYMRDYFSEKKDFDFGRQLSIHLIYYACNIMGMECHYAVNIQDAKQKIDIILNDSKLIEAFKGFKIPKVSIKLRMQLLFMKYRMSFVLAVLLRRG